MYQLVIRLLKNNKTIDPVNCLFYACGTICYRRQIDNYGEEFKEYIYTQEEWEWSKKKFKYHQSKETYQEAITRRKIEKEISKLMEQYKYNGIYVKKDIHQIIDQVVSTYEQNHNLPIFKGYEQRKESKGLAFFNQIHDKYTEQAKELNCINEFELEPYGACTQDLIDTLLYAADDYKKWKEFEKDLQIKLKYKPYPQ